MNWANLNRRLRFWRNQAQEGSGHRVARASLFLEETAQLSPEWEDQLAFDSALSRALQSEPVPAGLREAILKESPPPAAARPRWRLPLRWAVAACALALAALPALLSGPTSFADFRTHIVPTAWAADGHLGFVANDLSQVQAWVHEQHGPWPTHFPKALGGLQVAGGRVFKSQGQHVTLICFATGMHHTHLFIIDRLSVPDRPGEQFPQLATCQGWETASWSRGEQTFILTGLKGMAFVKQFRNQGHWSWSG